MLATGNATYLVPVPGRRSSLQSLTEVKIAVGQNDQNVRFTRLHVLHLFQSVRVRVKNNLSEQSDTQVAISASALKLRDYHSNIRLLLSSYSSNSLSYF